MITWTTAFLDLPAPAFGTSVEFWQAVTECSLSAPRGEYAEFATLVPADGDAFLRVQRVLDGPGGIHLDLHVAAPHDAATVAVSLGATLVADRGYVVMRSPGGFVFCFVAHPASVRPPVTAWGSLVDQVCLDIPAPAFDAEVAFWEALTGWALRDSARPEFRSLLRPPGMPLRFLLQRLDSGSGPVRAHVDVACRDRAAEVSRHIGLGASVLATRPTWTVLADPAGATYCLTDRDPETGMLG